MKLEFRELNQDDEADLWRMLTFAAHEEMLEAVRNQPVLAHYVEGWGRIGDGGCVALLNSVVIGAAWWRLWTGEARGFGFTDAATPELAISVAPQWRGQGIGTQLLDWALEVARIDYAALSLSVREENPAVRLYQRMGFIEVPSSRRINRAGSVSFNMLLDFDGD